MTVLDLINRAMRLLGAANIGDTATNAEAQDALMALNGMVDAWALERLMLFTTARNVYPLVAGQQVYQIGPSGPDWIAPRPTKIDRAGLVIANSDPTQVLERPLKVLKTDADWAAIRIKGLTSTLPTKLYYDAGFSTGSGNLGSGNVAVWPNPTQANSVALYTPTTISQFTGLTQTINLPPGYQQLLAYNLAVVIAPEYDREPSQVVVAIAEDTKDKLKALNVRVNAMRVDPALVTQRKAFDWMVGE